MDRILVTGGAGFIGSNFIRYIRKKHPEDIVINVDKLTYAGNPDNLNDIREDRYYHFIHADISDAEKIDEIFVEYQPDYVVNFAAESHVDRSIIEPRAFVYSNILGTQVLLDACKKYWLGKEANQTLGKKYVQISTDEVYGSLGDIGYFTELMPLAPNSPYSASKAGADLIIRAYFQTYGLPVNITRCSNNYGPYQFPEKLIPLFISNAINDMSLPLYGDGMNIRDWLFVEDHCSAIDIVTRKGSPGEVYNIGGNNEKTNIDIAYLILSSLNKPKELIKYVKDRPGHDKRYAVDSSKIRRELNWQPEFTFDEAMNYTIEWYKNNEMWLQRIKTGEYLKLHDRLQKY